LRFRVRAEGRGFVDALYSTRVTGNQRRLVSARVAQQYSGRPVMEIFSTPFLMALLTIIVIDLVLAGDNALVIGLAARNVPQHLQKRVILWGTAGAIAIRIVFTLGIVWLLKIPGLMLAGGLLLLPVAYKLMNPTHSSTDGHAAVNNGFWGALKTIIVADALMGVDNVLGVAGAANGSFLLVVLGLLISVPIMVWGSTLVLKWVDRFPAIITIGSGVLIWTATQMILDEKLLAAYLPAHTWFDELSGAILTAAILGAFMYRQVRNKRARAKSAALPASASL
jgi:YjbE family integral membrane protein